MFPDFICPAWTIYSKSSAYAKIVAHLAFVISLHIVWIYVLARYSLRIKSRTPKASSNAEKKSISILPQCWSSLRSCSIEPTAFFVLFFCKSIGMLLLQVHRDCPKFKCYAFASPFLYTHRLVAKTAFILLFGRPHTFSCSLPFPSCSWDLWKCLPLVLTFSCLEGKGLF